MLPIYMIKISSSDKTKEETAADSLGIVVMGDREEGSGVPSTIKCAA